MRLVPVLVVVACGGTPPQSPVTTKPAAPPAPASVTCEEVGIILRGNEVGYGEDSGPEKVRAITTACRDDKWSRAAIDCVASTPHPEDCLDKLDAKQQAGYEQRLQEWSSKYPEAGPYVPTQIACADVTADVTKYAPAIGDTGDERDWHLATRKHFLEEECEHSWNEALKECVLKAGPDATAIVDCRTAMLDQAENDALDQKLLELDRVARQIAKTKRKPASFACKQVVAHHYADANWKQKLDGFKPAERKRMIAESRQLMTKACTKETWTDTTRACVVADGGDWCWNQFDKARWGTPATGAVTQVGIRECDDYSAAVMRFAKCGSVSDQSREAITRSQQLLLAQIARQPAAERAKMGTSCKAGLEAVETTLSSSGC